MLIAGSEIGKNYMIGHKLIALIYFRRLLVLYNVITWNIARDFFESVRGIA